MRRRRVVFVVAAAGAASFAFVVSCTFPDVAFAPAGDGADASSSDGSASDAADDRGADVTEDVSDDVQVLVDGGDPDALIVKDPGGKVDTSGCTSCDCDNDGYYRAGCDAGPTTAARDCDDDDSRAHPEHGYLLENAEPPLNGDWNCAHGRESFYTPNVVCKNVTPGAACDSTFGFEDNPGCNKPGSFVTCKSAGGVLGLLQTCVVGSRSLTTLQACK